MGRLFRFSLAGFSSDLQIVSQVPSAKFTQVAQSISVETLLTPIPGWVEGPFSPQRSRFPLSFHLLAFLFIFLPFPNSYPFSNMRDSGEKEFVY